MASERASTDFILVVDRKTRAGIQKRIKRSTIPTFEALEKLLREVFQVASSEKVQVFDDANREIVDDDSLRRVATKQVLYLWRSSESDIGSSLVNASFDSGEEITSSFVRYHPCKVKQPLVAALANLIDGAIYGTAFLERERIIKISLHSQAEAINGSSDFLTLVDNGRGIPPAMISKWAKNDSSGIPSCTGQPVEIVIPRSLTSTLSSYCVGDKQSIFAIGSSFQLFTKRKGQAEVYRLCLTRDDFEKLMSSDTDYYAPSVEALQIDDVYCFNLKEQSIVNALRPVFERESFTAVVIFDIPEDHLFYLRKRISEWTTELAHVYHYYIHGQNGNVIFKDQQTGAKQWSTVRINVDVHSGDTSCLSLDLANIDSDFQSRCILSCTNIYSFKVCINDVACIEGIVRYHPILNGKETYPRETDRNQGLDIEDDYHEPRGRGSKPIFECYWNGRLMPCTPIEEFEWCSSNNEYCVVPKECFSRLSGVLFADNSFMVRPDKHGFVDLAEKLKDKESTTFVGLSKIGKDVKTAIEKDFADWLSERHFNDDKEIKFRGHCTVVQFSETMSSPTDLWSEYNEIDWNGTVFSANMLVRSTSMNPVICGTVTRFLLKGKHDGDVYGADGIVEVIQEPRNIYGDPVHFAISHLDRKGDSRAIGNLLELEKLRLPHWIDVKWPEGQQIDDCSRHGVGTVLGSVKLCLFDGMNEVVFKPPGPSRNGKLCVEMKVVYFGTEMETVLFQSTSHTGEHNSFWFDCSGLELQLLGPYSIFFQVLSEEENRLVLCGRQLPSRRINFTVKEGEPESFTVRYLEGPFCVGIPFQIPLEFADKMGNMTKPEVNTLSPELEFSDNLNIELKHGPVIEKDGNIIISDVLATGTVTGKALSLKVSLPSMKGASQTLKMRLLPGPPAVLAVEPEEVRIEHGGTPVFTLKFLDKFNNVTGHPMARVCCKFLEIPRSPVIVECFQPETQVVTFDDLVVDGSSEERRVTVVFEVQGIKDIQTVNRTIVILPSSEPAIVRLFYSKGNVRTEIKSNEDLHCTVGSAITKLEFEMYDEAGRLVPIDRIDIASLKVSWCDKLGKKAKRGRLPNVKAATSVTEIKRCTFTYRSDQHFSFSVRPIAAEPSAIVCKASGSTIVRLGQVLSSHILVTVYDKYGNVVQTNKSSLVALSVQAEGLVIEETVRSLGQNCNFDIGGIRFADKKLGRKAIAVDWDGLKGTVEVTVAPGLPAALVYLDWPLDEMPLAVSNEEQLPHPLRVQLSDEMGNAVKDHDVKVQLVKPSNLKMFPCEVQLRTDAYGRVDFGKPYVCGPSGTYDIHFKAFVGRTYVTCQPLSLKLNASSPAATRIEVKYPAVHQKMVAGSMFDVIEVTVWNEITRLLVPDPLALTMKYVSCDVTAASSPKAKSSSDGNVCREIEGSCEVVLDATNGSLMVRNAEVPKLAGNYEIIFSYKNSSKMGDMRRVGAPGKRRSAISSAPQKLIVIAGDPAVLGPVTLLSGTVTVDASDSTIMKELLLQLQDAYGNRSGLGVEGTLHANIVCQDESTPIPKFFGSLTELRVPLSCGRATFKPLRLESEFRGVANREYRVEFKAVSPALTAPLFYSLPFIMKNGSESEMSAARKEYILSEITKHENLLAALEETRVAFEDRVKKLKGCEAGMRRKLKDMGNPGSDLELPDIRRLVQHKIAEYQSLNTCIPRCTTVLPTAPGDHDVLGKVCHLAYIEDDDVARVISWHLASLMEVVVVRTYAKAMQMSAIQPTQSSFLAVDNLEDSNGAGWFIALPHEQLGLESPVQGSITYAKHSLRFVRHYDECLLVFGMLLGDAILVDCMPDAQAYRSMLFQAGQSCPTILTRDGYRLPSNGLVGGMQNCAPAMADLKGVVFDKPPSVPNAHAKNELGVLLEFESFLTRIQEAENEKAYLVNADYMLHTQEMKLYVDSLKRELELGSAVENSSSTATAPASAAAGEVVHVVRPTLVLVLDEDRSVKSENVSMVKLLSHPYQEGEELVSTTVPRLRDSPGVTTVPPAVALSEARTGSQLGQEGAELNSTGDNDFTSFSEIRPSPRGSTSSTHLE